MDPNPWNMVKHNYPVGARVRGNVRNLTSYGAFVELEKGGLRSEDITVTEKAPTRVAYDLLMSSYSGLMPHLE